MGENPRVVKRAAADAHARAAGRVEHQLRGLRAGDVAVADDRDALHRRDDAPDARQIHRAVEALLPRAAVDHDRGAPVSSNARARSGAVRFSSSQPRRILQVTGMRTALTIPRTRAEVRLEFRHHRRAAADLADLPHGAAHVDVDRGDAERFEHLRGVGHFLGHGAEKLHGQGSVLRAAFDQLERLVVFLQQRAGVDEVGGAEADAAEFADDAAKREIGITGQRR